MKKNYINPEINVLEVSTLGQLMAISLKVPTGSENTNVNILNKKAGTSEKVDWFNDSSIGDSPVEEE